MAYEQLKNHWSIARGGKDKLTNPDFLLLSAVSKVFAGSITYPYQVVRARLQTYDANDKYHGAKDVVKQVWAKEGLKGFYKGYRLLRLQLDRTHNADHTPSQTRTQHCSRLAYDVRDLFGLRKHQILLATPIPHQ